MTSETEREQSRLRAKAWRDANPELHRANVRAWKAANPDSALAHARSWKAAHPEETRVGRAAWRDANRERIRFNDAARRAANPDAMRRYTANRRALERSAFVESIEPGIVFDRDAGVCQICDTWVLANEEWHVDHVVPLSRGGLHTYSNVQLAHGYCNRVKGAKAINEIPQTNQGTNQP